MNDLLVVLDFLLPFVLLLVGTVPAATEAFVVNPPSFPLTRFAHGNRQSNRPRQKRHASMFRLKIHPLCALYSIPPLSPAVTSPPAISCSFSSKALDPNTKVVPKMVEKRVDPFGGTGLFATQAISKGETLFETAPDTGVVFGATAGSALQDCVEDFVIGQNGFTESLSIGASMAVWRIFQDIPRKTPQQQYNHKRSRDEGQHASTKLETRVRLFGQGDGRDASFSFCGVSSGIGGSSTGTYASNSIPCNPLTMRAAGISDAATEHAANLPWDISRWQLPLLWPVDILNEALLQGVQQQQQQQQLQQGVVLHAQPHPSQKNSYTTKQQEEASLQEACDKVHYQIKQFHLAGDRLAEELEPFLRREFGIVFHGDHNDEPDLLLICHQAMAMVFSRTFLHPPSGELTLLPWIDSANHNGPDANTDLKIGQRGSGMYHANGRKNGDNNNDHTVDPSTAPCSKTAETEGHLKLVASKHISKGEEITITYGLEESSGNNIIAFAGYGFIPEGMADASPVGRALQLACVHGQALVQARIKQQQQQQQSCE